MAVLVCQDSLEPSFPPKLHQNSTTAHVLGNRVPRLALEIQLLSVAWDFWDVDVIRDTVVQ